MNTETGEIRTLEPEESPLPDEIQLDRTPNPGCKLCFGKGYLGRDSDGKLIPCGCTMNKPPPSALLFVPALGGVVNINTEPWIITKVLPRSRIMLKKYVGKKGGKR